MKLMVTFEELRRAACEDFDDGYLHKLMGGTEKCDVCDVLRACRGKEAEMHAIGGDFDGLRAMHLSSPLRFFLDNAACMPGLTHALMGHVWNHHREDYNGYLEAAIALIEGWEEPDPSAYVPTQWGPTFGEKVVEQESRIAAAFKACEKRLAELEVEVEAVELRRSNHAIRAHGPVNTRLETLESDVSDLHNETAKNPELIDAFDRILALEDRLRGCQVQTPGPPAPATQPRALHWVQVGPDSFNCAQIGGDCMGGNGFSARDVIFVAQKNSRPILLHDTEEDALAATKADYERRHQAKASK